MDMILSSNRPKSGSNFKITGSYILDGYDDNLELWLDSLGINGEKMGPIFRQTKVKIMVKAPSQYNKKWNLAHREEGMQLEVSSIQFYVYFSSVYYQCFSIKQ